eukprot:TRINITY_DN2671_c0_g2_i1.p1 TRINITY_DN2671_c0_g2~~TRINITY_DN2671_c0_g2_i1.p1  ORF type:complete len:128 (+),score=25.53 TRINITY_DN2671_c0_g2_i1:40-423(+)
MFYQVIFATAFLVSFASGAAIDGDEKMSCPDCKTLAFTVGSLAVSEGGLNGSYSLVRDPVCKSAPKELECEKNLPAFWNILGSWIFNPLEGWYSDQYFCEDVCTSESENEVANGISCRTCEIGKSVV